MKLVLEIRAHLDKTQVSYCTVERFPATVGRGYDNDVIVHDPYVDPRHLRLEQEGGDFFLRDLGSANGLSLNGVRQRGRVRIRSGDMACIGQTDIRLYVPEHPVAPAVPAPKDNLFFARLSRPLNVWTSFMLALALTTGWAYLELWTAEAGPVLAAAAAGSAVTIVLWTGVWSVVGRLIRHRADFKSHLTLISLYMIAGTLGWYVEAYVDFLASENWLSRGVMYGVNFALLAALLYGSLTLATVMARRRRFFAAAFFSGGLVAGAALLGLVSAKSFNQQPQYPDTLKPYLSWLAPTQTIDRFMDGNERLFSSAVFKEAGGI